MIWHTVYQSKRLKIAPPLFYFFNQTSVWIKKGIKLEPQRIRIESNPEIPKDSHPQWIQFNTVQYTVLQYHKQGNILFQKSMLFVFTRTICAEFFQSQLLCCAGVEESNGWKQITHNTKMKQWNIILNSINIFFYL